MGLSEDRHWKKFGELFGVLTVPADKIRVGRDYQAVCPELQPEALRKPELLADRALLVWSPTAEIPESKCRLPLVVFESVV